MDKVKVVLYDRNDPNSGYVLEGLRNRSSRWYGSYEEAKRDADRINRAREKYYENIEIKYENVYDGGNTSGWIASYDLPHTSDPDDPNPGGTTAGRGYFKIFSDSRIWFDTNNPSLKFIIDNYGSDSDVMVFLRQVAMNYNDNKVRNAVARYIFGASSYDEL